MIASLKKMDLRLLNFIDVNFKNPILDKVMLFITSLGNLGAVWIFISLILALNEKYRTASLLILSSLLLTTFTGELIIKHIIRRQRPFSDVPKLNMRVRKPMTYSFPSGHTASSFASATIFWVIIKDYNVPVTILASLIAFSRLYLKVHYLTDVFIGILLGISCSLIVLAIYM